MKNSNNKIIVILSFALITVLSCSALKGMAPTNSVNSDEKPIFIQAGDLIEEYKESQSSADAKYKGKLLAVTGKVNGTLQTRVYSWITIYGESFSSADKANPKGVGCALEQSENVDVDKIKASRIVTIVGINEGIKPAKMVKDGEYIDLQNCRIGDESTSDEARKANEERIKSIAEKN